jgi:SAM-dependent methyltransferase
LRHLSKLLASVAPTTNRKSAGSAPPTSERLTFVRDALAGFAPSRVLDIGCHSGHFSVIAAQSGADVTAIDSDPIAAGALWRRALFENLPILPLIVNLVRPTPAAGWNNAETPSFLDRARGHFDAVLMLSPISGIPPAVVLDLAAELVSHSSIGTVVVESAQEDFAAATRRRFDMVRAQGNLYLLRRKP